MTTPPKPIVTKPAASRQPSGLSAQTPLLLLPVNIQTRFMNPQKGSAELWVRIYPDQVAVDSHEPELTNQEVSDGQAYWNARGRQEILLPYSEYDAKAPWRTVASLVRCAARRVDLFATHSDEFGAEPVAPTPERAPPPYRRQYFRR